MAVLKKAFKNDFTVMSNHHLRSITISLKAVGLMSKMLSLPDNWEYTETGLAKICMDGIDAIRSAIKELEKAGYLYRERARNEKGHLVHVDYLIFQDPIDNPNFKNGNKGPRGGIGFSDNDKEGQIEENPIQRGHDNVGQSHPNGPTLENPMLVKIPPFGTKSEARTALDYPVLENPILDNPMLDNPMLDNPVLDNPIQSNTNQSNTNQLNTKRLKDDDYRPLGKNISIVTDGDQPEINNRTELIHEKWRLVGRVLSHPMYVVGRELLENAHVDAYQVAWAKNDYDRVLTLEQLSVSDCMEFVDAYTKQGRNINSPKQYAEAVLQNATADLPDKRRLKRASASYFEQKRAETESSKRA